MTDVKIRNVNEQQLASFDQFCSKNGKSRQEMLKEFISNAGNFNVIVDTELRMKAILEDVLVHLDLNTQAYLLNVKMGMMPAVSEMFGEGGEDHEVILDSTE